MPRGTNRLQEPGWVADAFHGQFYACFPRDHASSLSAFRDLVCFASHVTSTRDLGFKMSVGFDYLLVTRSR
jgi:hypothetical protein